MGLVGPQREITVQPVEKPIRVEPMPDTPAPEPAPEKAPEKVPEKTPEKVPA